MAQPLSIGDIYLLSKLSWRIGRALGPGRKSAANEIGEVQNQLFALGKALNLSGDAYEQNEILGDSQSFQKMLLDCRDTLRHLEKLMEKYEDVDRPTKQDPHPLRLKENVIRNWTKIKWTIKGGDVSDLRDALRSHISAINLTLSALNVERGKIIEYQTGHILQMAEEMYRSWKNGKPAQGTESQQTTRPFGTLARSTIYIQEDMSVHEY